MHSMGTQISAMCAHAPLVFEGLVHCPGTERLSHAPNGFGWPRQAHGLASADLWWRRCLRTRACRLGWLSRAAGLLDLSKHPHERRSQFRRVRNVSDWMVTEVLSVLLWRHKGRLESLGGGVGMRWRGASSLSQWRGGHRVVAPPMHHMRGPVCRVRTETVDTPVLANRSRYQHSAGRGTI
jgi:hypothetical protein